MTVTYEPLNDLTTQQLDKILEKFQLISRHHDAAEKIQIIKCIGLYDSKLGEIPDEDIVVGFNRNGDLHEIKSKDDTVKLMQDESLCNKCSKKVDKKDVGFRCEGCTQFFHNKCTSSPVTKAVFDIIVTTPQWVQVFCPKCMNAPKKAEEDLKEIKQSMEEIKEKVTVTKSYSSATKQLENSVKNTQAMVKNLASRKENTEQLAVAVKERNDRTRIVRKPIDKEIRNSSNIRKLFNKEFPAVVIRNCRTTAAGSILIEFDNSDEAENIQGRWNKDFFGGNDGMEKVEQGKHIGIIKHIYTAEDEDAIKAEVDKNYPGATAELFKRPDGTFMGTLKVKFRDEDQMKQANTDRFNLFRQRYFMEDYKPKPKVIKCNYCQKFGHIARLCRSKKPKCGKCSSENHETQTCHEEAENYKCAHCDGNHNTGSGHCEIWKNKEEELARNYSYG